MINIDSSSRSLFVLNKLESHFAFRTVSLYQIPDARSEITSNVTSIETNIRVFQVISTITLSCIDLLITHELVIIYINNEEDLSFSLHLRMSLYLCLVGDTRREMRNNLHVKEMETQIQCQRSDQRRPDLLLYIYASVIFFL